MTGWDTLAAAWEADAVESDDEGAARPSPESVAMHLRVERAVVVNDDDMAAALIAVLAVEEAVAQTQATKVLDFLLNRGATPRDV